MQATERDEFAYQEMMVHPVLCCHPAPHDVRPPSGSRWTARLRTPPRLSRAHAQVLVIGGGDGGCLREICRHPAVQRVTICEIDQLVMDVSKEHMKQMSSGFSDPRCETDTTSRERARPRKRTDGSAWARGRVGRVSVVCGDGKEFLRDKVSQYDVIIIDSSDPVGPASGLYADPPVCGIARASARAPRLSSRFGDEFYELARASLKPSGSLAAQGESVWLHLDLIKEMMAFCRSKFPVVEYGVVQIPTCAALVCPFPFPHPHN